MALLEARSTLLFCNVLTVTLMLAISASLSTWLLGKMWSSCFGYVSLSLAGHNLLFDLAVFSLGCDCVGFLLRTLRVHQFWKTPDHSFKKTCPSLPLQLCPLVTLCVSLL